MKIYISLIILFCTFCSTELLSQENIYSIYNSKKSSNTFQYKGELLQFPDMNEIFKQDIEAHQMYNSAIRNKQRAKNLRNISLATMGLASLAIALDRPKPEDLLGYTTGNVLGILAWIFVVPSTGIAAIINKAKYHNKKHKAISLFNNSSDISFINNQEDWKLKIGQGQYGYGLVLNF